MAYKIDYCGIYKIENLINGKVYIGQSVSIKTRWNKHLNYLKKGIHENDHLQKAWNKYGENNFSHEILELCQKEELNNKEKYYIKLFNSSDGHFGYNMTDGGDNANTLISLTAKEKQKEKISGLNSSQRKEVICLETKEVYISIIEAAKSVNVDYSAITKCCNGISNTCRNFHWMFYEDYLNCSTDEILDKMSIKPPIREKKVIYLNTGEIFNSIKEASEITQINVNSISQCCTHRRKQAGTDINNQPRIFMYYEEFLQKDLEESA